MQAYSREHKNNPNPKTSAGVLSTLTFFYTIQTYLQSYRKSFTEDDIYDTIPEHKSNNLGSRAIKLWTQELEKCKIKSGKTPSLFKVLVKLLWRKYLLLLFTSLFIEVGPRVYASLSLGEFIDSYNEKNYYGTYLYGGSLVACSFLSVAVFHPYCMQCYNMGLKVQIACSSLIYHKILKLNKSTLRDITPGQIINLLSNDLVTFEVYTSLSHYIFIVPVQTIMVLYYTYREVGISAIIGASLILFFLPIHYIAGRLISKYRLKTSIKRDERIRLTNEIIQGIHIIKMYAWEKPFASIVSLCRKFEIKSITMSSYLKGAFALHMVFITTSIFITILSSTAFGISISARSAFIVTTLYNIFGLCYMVFLPQAIAAIEEGKISLMRISKFLLSDEIQTKNIPKSKEYAISIEHGSAKWDRSSEQPTFSKLYFNIKYGSLAAVIGPVGSGKSSLLHVVLQELPLLSGDLSVNGTLSYASQESWIFSASVRNNILFGNKMDEERYKKVVKCCALEHDFKVFPYGDNTTVGERGASLSGGQKARINLARAIYREADIYLLDDPLSAVDTHVGKQIFEDCIQTFLKNKTVILITHQLQYLKYVDHIVVLDNGSITVEGSPVKLETTGFDFAKYLQRTEDKSTEDKSSSSNSSKLLNGYSTVQAPKVQGEGQITDTMPFIIFKDYILASKSYVRILFASSSFILTQLLTSLSFFFVAYWVKTERELQIQPNDNLRRLNMYIYSIITLATIFFTMMRTITYINLSMKSSRALHRSMFEKVVHASLKFFNNNSSGRILNRFAKDLGTIDEILPNATIVALRNIFTACGVLIVVSVVNQWFIIPTVVFMVTVYLLRKVYLHTNLDVVRVESVTRSPIYGYANTSLQGLATIRACGVQEILTKEFYSIQDERSSVYYLYLTIARSFSYFTDLVCIIYLGTVTLFCTLNKESTGESIGLIISQVFLLMGLLPFGIRNLTDVESYMISVERVMEYNTIEQERELNSTPKNKPSSTWPEKGEIRFTKVFLKYSEDDPYVLKNLNFTIEPQQKIGIVGRTGAGKSSIITTLFQLAENEGVITIDGVDIQKIGLHDLRQKMSIIPQDPVLFSGTVRKNLDPFDEYKDEDLWKALEEVRLKEVVDIMGSGLNSEILQNGSNLSVGQRQLICLARAIIRNNKILILDEATANVDLKTDEIIQETIRANFSNCTVLTVAHRLNTIMDSDKVLVMDSGEALEFDHPHILLQNKESTFYKMVHQTEESISKTLMDISKKNYQQKQLLNGTREELMVK